ncbi:hypothetical protein [Vreelandella arcis]|uniref:Uncharacterized protein n=1 Tax=Vreelandella arcis TaxID=416873 RepID=A0A1H0CXY9_9GAMM|nr:hypothetical protein [Halomonas arcis]SDN62757.1 hypothetical protein SAMN04487951_106240 [Halomonas arcis]
MKSVKDIMVSVVESIEELESFYEIEVSFSLSRNAGRFLNMQTHMSITSDDKINSTNNGLEENKWF